MEFIDLKRQYNRIKESIDINIKSVLDNTDFINGNSIKELEDKLASYVGVSHCVTTSSGTDALLLSLMVLNLKPGDEVITTPFTFISAAEVISLCGATPVLVDIDLKTCNIDVQKIEGAITSKTKAIMPVSLYGYLSNYEYITDLAKKYNLVVIEDGAQSFGSTYKGKRSCSLTDMGCTSFFPSKPLGCYGDGGAIFTDNDIYANKLRELKNHGQSQRYVHSSVGLCARLDTIQAAVLLSKLEIFEDEIKLRQNVSCRYIENLKNKVRITEVESDCMSVFAQFTVFVENRPSVVKYLQSQGIPTVVHYPIPVHEQSAYTNQVRLFGALGNAEYAASKVLSLPFHPYMSNNEIDYICNKLIEAIQLYEEH